MCGEAFHSEKFVSYSSGKFSCIIFKVFSFLLFSRTLNGWILTLIDILRSVFIFHLGCLFYILGDLLTFIFHSHNGIILGYYTSNSQ